MSVLTARRAPAPAIPPAQQQPSVKVASPRRRKKRPGGQFDTALGWSPRGWPLVVRIVLCTLALFVFAFPFVTMFAGAFDMQTNSTELSIWPTHPTLKNFQVAADQGLWGYFANSLIIVGGGLLLQIVFSICAAYALSRRKRFAGQAIVGMLFLLTMMLPEEVIAIPLSSVLSHLPIIGVSLKGSPLGVILPVAVWGFSIFIMSEFMKEIPEEIIEAAKLDGVGEIRMLWQIVLPLSKPVLGVVVIFGFQMIWNQYLLPLIAANGEKDYPLTVALSVLQTDPTFGTGILLAGSVVALVPSLIVYLLMQRSMIRGITTGAVKG